jgi:predicted nucleic acid-binding protein
MTSLIVDASVALKWFFTEADSKGANKLRDEELDFIAPELIIAEIGNAAWKKLSRKEIDAAGAVFVIRHAPLVFASLVPIIDLAEAAMRLSARLLHPIYDCFYLALAERERTPVVSADKRLLAAAKRLPSIAARSL